jgi:hypothetical protein
VCQVVHKLDTHTQALECSAVSACVQYDCALHALPCCTTFCHAKISGVPLCFAVLCHAVVCYVCPQMLMDLGKPTYEADFEHAFLADAAEFYKKEAAEFLAQNNAPDYMCKVGGAGGGARGGLAYNNAPGRGGRAAAAGCSRP